MGLTGKDSLNFVFMFTSAVLLTYGPMTAEKGGPGSIFSYHPLLMSLGFGLMISMGFWMFNYEDLPGEWIDSRSARRKAHALCQLTGISLIVMGYLAVMKAHRDTPGTKLFQVSDPDTASWTFTIGPSWIRLAHVIIGYLALGLMVVQLVVGALKYRSLTDDDDDNDAEFSYHETIGNALFACGISNILIGVWLWEAWSLAVRAAISLTLCTSLVFGPRWDGSRGFLASPGEGESHSKKKKSNG